MIWDRLNQAPKSKLFFKSVKAVSYSHSFKISSVYSTFYLVFLFWKVFVASLKSFLGYRKVSERETKTTVTLSWNNKKIQLNFKEFPRGFDEATVKDLKEKCKLLTDVPIASMKLQVSGGKLIST